MIIFHTDGQDMQDFLQNMTEEAVSRDDEDLMVCILMEIMQMIRIVYFINSIMELARAQWR